MLLIFIETLKILQESLTDFSKFTNEYKKKNNKNDNSNDIKNIDSIDNNIDPSKIFLPYKEKRETCYQCYKIHLDSLSIIYLGKKFCTKECMNACIEEESVIKYILNFFLISNILYNI